MKNPRDSRMALRGEIPIEAKRGRGRPRKVNTDQKSPTNNIILMPEIADNTILLELNDINMKGDFSEKEIKFLECYLPGEMKQENAARLAGYASTCDRYLRKIAQKIIQKYEARTEDHRKIMRALGYGEVKVLQLLIDSAINAKSETVRLNARITLAKCIGLHKEVQEEAEGITIVFQGASSPGEQPTTAAELRPVAPPVSGPNIRMIK